jgi:hypothetical protein
MYNSSRRNGRAGGSKMEDRRWRIEDSGSWIVKMSGLAPPAIDYGWKGKSQRLIVSR